MLCQSNKPLSMRESGLTLQAERFAWSKDSICQQKKPTRVRMQQVG